MMSDTPEIPPEAIEAAARVCDERTNGIRAGNPVIVSDEQVEALRKIVALDPHHDDDGAVIPSDHCATCIARAALTAALPHLRANAEAAATIERLERRVRAGERVTEKWEALYEEVCEANDELCARLALAQGVIEAAEGMRGSLPVSREWTGPECALADALATYRAATNAEGIGEVGEG